VGFFFEETGGAQEPLQEILLEIKPKQKERKVQIQLRNKKKK